MLPYLLAAGVALVVTLLGVPPTIRLAHTLNLLDAPDAVRRLHHLAVPRVGGIAVWLGVACGVLAGVLLPPALGLTHAPALTPDVQALAFALTAGAALMVAIGLVDDVRGVRPRHKLFAQLFAATIVVAAGFRIDALQLSATLTVDLGWLGAPLAVFWIVGVTNAFNLIDGLDGLAGGVALVGLSTLGISGVLLGNHAVLLLALPLGASLVGFLRFNTARPSRIFLGDVGSLSVGFVLAVLTIEAARVPAGASQGAVTPIVPLFALAFPILDTGIAMLRRWLRGVPLMSADGRHVHHQLVCLGLSRGRAAAAICLFSACFAGLGLSLVFAPRTFTLALALLSGAAAVLFLAHGLRWLRYHEFLEAQASVVSGLFKARGVIRDRILARELENRIRTAESLPEVEMVLDDVVRTFGFEHVALVDAAAISRGDELRRQAADRRLLRLDYPLGTTGKAKDDGLVLRMWWRHDASPVPRYAERIARMLVPALEHALAQMTPSAADRAVSVLTGSALEYAPPASAAAKRRQHVALASRKR